MSGGGGFRGRGFVPRGHGRQGSNASGGPNSRSNRPNSRLGNANSRARGPRGSRAGVRGGGGGNQRPNISNPRNAVPEPRYDGPNSRLDVPISRGRAQRFGGGGSGGPPTTSRPNFNQSRHPQRHQCRQPDNNWSDNNWSEKNWSENNWSDNNWSGNNWSPQTVTPPCGFPAWQGGPPPPFNTPPPFFNPREQNTFVPFRFPPPMTPNYQLQPPNLLELPPMVEQKPQTPHLGSEEERLQKITEAADELKRKLSVDKKVPDAWYNENEDDGTVEFSSIDTDQDSRIANRGIPELKHDPPELNLTLSDLRDIGRVDHDHTTKVSCKPSNTSSSSTDDQEVTILEHSPVQRHPEAMIDIDIVPEDFIDYGNCRSLDKTTDVEQIVETNEVVQNFELTTKTTIDDCTSQIEEIRQNNCDETIDKENPEEREINGESLVEEHSTVQNIDESNDRENGTKDGNSQNLHMEGEMGDIPVEESVQVQAEMPIDHCKDENSNTRLDDIDVLQEDTKTKDAVDNQIHDEGLPCSTENSPVEHENITANVDTEKMEYSTVVMENEQVRMKSKELTSSETINVLREKFMNNDNQTEENSEIPVRTKISENEDFGEVLNDPTINSDKNGKVEISKMNHDTDISNQSRNEAMSKIEVESGTAIVNEIIKETSERMMNDGGNVTSTDSSRDKLTFVSRDENDISKDDTTDEPRQGTSCVTRDEYETELCCDNVISETKHNFPITEPNRDNATRQGSDETMEIVANVTNKEELQMRETEDDAPKEIVKSQSSRNEDTKLKKKQFEKTEYREKSESTSINDSKERPQSDERIDEKFATEITSKRDNEKFKDHKDYQQENHSDRKIRDDKKSKDRQDSDRKASGNKKLKNRQDCQQENVSDRKIRDDEKSKDRQDHQQESISDRKTRDDKKSEDRQDFQSESQFERTNVVRKTTPENFVTKSRKTMTADSAITSLDTDPCANDSQHSLDSTSSMVFDPREPPPSTSSIAKTNYGISSTAKRPNNEFSLSSVKFDPKQPPPNILGNQEIGESKLPPAFDPRLSSHERSVILSSAIPINQDFAMTQGYPPCSMTNLMPNVTVMNYVGPPQTAMMATSIDRTSNIPPICMTDPYAPLLSLPNVPIVPPLVMPNDLLLQPPLPTQLPPPSFPLPKSNLDMDAELEDMQEAMEFAKQFMYMTETGESTINREIADPENSDESDFFHMPTFPDLPPIELPPTPPIAARPPEKNIFTNRQSSSTRENKKSNKSTKTETITYGPAPMPEEYKKIIDKIEVVEEIPGINGEQMRPKVVFNLSSKTKKINKHEEWHQQQHRDVEDNVLQATVPTPTASSTEITKNRRKISANSTAPVLATIREKLRIANGHEERKKRDDKTSCYNGKIERSSPKYSHNKIIEETKSRSRTPTPPRPVKHGKNMKEASTAEVSTNVETSKNEISSKRTSKESSAKKTTEHLMTPELSWKNRVIGRFLKMSKNDIGNMLNNASLRKFDIAMKHLVKERRSSLSFEMRNNEEERTKGAEVSYNREEFMDQLSAMLDPSATVDVGNLPTQFIHHLSEVLQLDAMSDIEGSLTMSEAHFDMSSPLEHASLSMETHRVIAETRNANSTREIDGRGRASKKKREKRTSNTLEGIGATCLATSTGTLEKRTVTRTSELNVESPICETVSANNIVEENTGSRTSTGSRSRRRRCLRTTIIDQQAASRPMINNGINETEQGSLNMADLDDIFTAGIARAKKKIVANVTNVITPAKDERPRLMTKIDERSVDTNAKDPSVDRVERAVVELDEIFTAGIARAKLASKKAAEAAKAAEADDGDEDDDDERSWNQNDPRSNLDIHRSRQPKTISRHNAKFDKWNRRKTREEPVAFRNLTKEEWEAKYGESSYTSYQRECRVIAAFRAQQSKDSSQTSVRNDFATPESGEIASVKSRLGEPVSINSENHETWSGSDEARRFRNIDEPENCQLNYPRENESSSSTTSTSSDSSDNDDESTPSVTKLLKVIKEREKIAKKKSLNEEIRDEVTAEIERKRRERGNVRKRHKSRTKRSGHRRKRDKKEKGRDRKRRDRKRRKRKTRKSGQNSRESSDNEDADEEYTSSASRGQHSRQLLAENEIKTEVVIKIEPEFQSTFSSEKRPNKAAMNVKLIDDSRPASTASSSSIPSIVALPVVSVQPVPNQPKTKAQLKQMPEIAEKTPALPKIIKETAKNQETRLNDDASKNVSTKIVASLPSEISTVVNETSNSPIGINSTMTVTPVSIQQASTGSDDTTSSSKSISKKLDIKTYKERARVRQHQETEKLRLITENPSSLTQNLLNIPLIRKKPEVTEELVQETVKDPRLTKNKQISSTTTSAHRNVINSTTITSNICNVTSPVNVSQIKSIENFNNTLPQKVAEKISFAKTTPQQKSSPGQTIPQKISTANTPSQKIAPTEMTSEKIPPVKTKSQIISPTKTTTQKMSPMIMPRKKIIRRSGVTTAAAIVDPILTMNDLPVDVGKFAHIKSEGRKELKLREKLKRGRSRTSVEGLESEILPTPPTRLKRLRSLATVTSTNETVSLATELITDQVPLSKNSNITKTSDTVRESDGITTLNNSKDLDTEKTLNNSKIVDITRTLDNSKTVDITKTFVKSKDLDNTETLDSSKTVDTTKTLDKSRTIDNTKTLDNSKDVDTTKTLDSPKTVDTTKTLDQSRTVDTTKSLDVSEDLDTEKPLNNSKTLDTPKVLYKSKTADTMKRLDKSKDLDITKTSYSSKTMDATNTFDNSERLDITKNLITTNNMVVTNILDKFRNFDATETLDKSKNVDGTKTLNDSKNVDTVVSSINLKTLDAPKTLEDSKTQGTTKSLDNSKTLHTTKTLDKAKILNTTTTLDTSKALDTTITLNKCKNSDIIKKLDSTETLDKSQNFDTTNILIATQRWDSTKTFDDSKDVEVTKTFGSPKLLDNSRNEETTETFNSTMILDDSTNVETRKIINNSSTPDITKILDYTGNVDATETVENLNKMDTTETYDNSKTLDTTQSVSRSKILDTTKIADNSKTLDTIQSVSHSKILKTTKTVNNSKTLNKTQTVSHSKIVETTKNVDNSKAPDTTKTVDNSKTLDATKTVDMEIMDNSKTAEAKKTLDIRKNVNASSKRLISDALPDTVPLDAFPIIPKIDKVLVTSSEFNALELPIEELPVWSLDVPTPSNLSETVDYSSDSLSPFKGFSKETILRRDRVLTETEVTQDSELEAFESVPLDFVGDPIVTASESVDLTTTEVADTLDVPVTYDEEEFAGSTVDIEASLPDPLGHTIFSVENEIPDVSVPIDIVPLENLANNETNDELSKSQDSIAIVPIVKPLLDDKLVNDVCFIDNVEKCETVPFPVLGEICKETKESNANELSLKDTTDERTEKENTVVPKNDETDVTLSKHLKNKSLTEHIPLEIESRNKETKTLQCSVNVATSENDICTEMETSLTTIDEDNSLCEYSEAREIHCKTSATMDAIETENSSKMSESTFPSLDKRDSPTYSSIRTDEETNRETEKSSSCEQKRDTDTRSRDSHHVRTSTRDHGHARSKKKSSRHHNHGSKASRKSPLTEKLIEDAISANIVKLVAKPSSRDTVMARMLEIDVEIHKLMNEKMTLYKMIESGDFTSRDTELPSNKTIDVAKIIVDKEDAVPEAAPSNGPASHPVRNVTRTTTEGTTKKSNAKRLNSGIDEKTTKRRKSLHRETKNRSRERDIIEARRERKNSETQSHARSTASEESNHRETALSHSREKSTSSTDLEDIEEKRRKRTTKSPNRRTSKRQTEHSSKEDLRHTSRDNQDRTVKTIDSDPKRDRTKKKVKARTESKKIGESAKKTTIVEDKTDEIPTEAASTIDRTVINTDVIYSDENTLDSQQLEATQVNDERTKKDNSSISGGLALLEESFKREIVEQRKVKGVDKRRNKKRELRRALLDPTILTADEAQTGLNNLLNRKSARKKEILSLTGIKDKFNSDISTSEDPKVWEHVSSVIDAVAKNCVEELYTEESCELEEDYEEEEEDEDKMDEIVSQSLEESTDKVTSSKDHEKDESTIITDFKEFIPTESKDAKKSLLQVEKQIEPSNLKEFESCEITAVPSESPNFDDVRKTPEIDIYEEPVIKPKTTIIHDGDISGEESSTSKVKFVEESFVSSDKLKSHREDKEQTEVRRTIKSRSVSPEYPLPQPWRIHLPEEKISENVEKIDQSSKEMNNEAPSVREVVSSINEIERKPPRSRSRGSRSAKKRGKSKRDSTKDKRYQVKDNRNSFKNDHSNDRHDDKSEDKSRRPRSLTKRGEQCEKVDSRSRRSSRQSEDSAKSTQNKKRPHERSNSRGLSPQEGEHVKKKNHHSHRSSCSTVSSALLEDQTRRRGKKRKCRPELSREEMTRCKVELVDCKYTYLSPTMHPKILKKLGVSRINSYVPPITVAKPVKNVLSPKLTKDRTPSPTLKKVRVNEIEKNGGKTGIPENFELFESKIVDEEIDKDRTPPLVESHIFKERTPSPVVSQIFKKRTPSPIESKIVMENVGDEEINRLTTASPMAFPIVKERMNDEGEIDKGRMSSSSEIHIVKENVYDDEDDEDDENIQIVKVADENLPMISISDQDDDAESVEGMAQDTLKRGENNDCTTEMITVEEDDDTMEEYEVIDEVTDENEDVDDNADQTDVVEVTENEEAASASTEKPAEPETLLETDNDGANNVEPRRTRYTVHKGPILDIKVLDDSFLAASEDGAIYRYSQTSNGILNIYKGHEAAVTCIYVLEMPGKRWNLYSGSLDGTFRCYDITTGVQDRPATVGSPVQCMDQGWGIIYVGTKSGHISRYNIKSSSIKGDRLEFSDKSVLALKASAEGPRRVLIVASRNQPITIRDAYTGLFLRTICGYKNHTVYSLMRERNLVYCGTSSTSIPVYDFTNGEQITQYSAGVGIVCMRLYRQILFAGCYDGNIYVFDTKETKLICSIPGPGNMLLSMEVVDDEIIAGSKNRQLHSWRMPEKILALLAERT